MEVVDGENRVVQYEYDSLNRLVKEILSEDQYVKPILEENGDNDSSDFTSVSYKPQIHYFYDDECYFK